MPGRTRQCAASTASPRSRNSPRARERNRSGHPTQVTAPRILHKCARILLHACDRADAHHVTLAGGTLGVGGNNTRKSMPSNPCVQYHGMRDRYSQEQCKRAEHTDVKNSLARHAFLCTLICTCIQKCKCACTVTFKCGFPTAPTLRNVPRPAAPRRLERRSAKRAPAWEGRAQASLSKGNNAEAAPTGYWHEGMQR